MPETAGPPVHAVVVDRRRLVREGVRTLLAADPRLRVDAVATVADAATADVLVLGDVTEPFSGPAVRLDQITDVDALADEVLAAAADGRSGTARPSLAALSTRERGVLRLVAQGLSAVEIGRELGISPRTVERHKQSLTAKLGAPNQARAVALSLANGRPVPASGRAG